MPKPTAINNHCITLTPCYKRSSPYIQGQLVPCQDTGFFTFVFSYKYFSRLFLIHKHLHNVCYLTCTPLEQRLNVVKERQKQTFYFHETYI